MNAVRLLLLGVIIASSMAQASGAEPVVERAQRMAWWRDARFGMFIHWGIMSIPGKDFNVMEKECIPVVEYEKLVQQYNPVQWNPREVVALAKGAGQKYLVLVAKHLDGFCLWDTRLTEFNVMRSPYGKDIVRQLADECARQGMVFCIYYSIIDWHHPSANQADWPRYVEYMRGQLRELLTNYGPIGVVWFDGDWAKEWTDEQGRAMAQLVWSLQPNTIINNRIGRSRQPKLPGQHYESFAGDFATPEQEEPHAIQPGVPWEACNTINHSWSWNSADTNYKSDKECLTLLVGAAARGGNLLLNIGPRPDGSIDAVQRQRLQKIGQWMAVNGEAIRGTSASPLTNVPPWGRCTSKHLGEDGTRLYLHVFEWPTDGRLTLTELTRVVRRAYLLAAPDTTLQTVMGPNGELSILVPAKPNDELATVVVLDLEGP